MSPPLVPVSSLRSHLLTALQGLPGSRIFHLHVLVSTSRKPKQSLFLYATTRPKCFVQDILILLSEETAEYRISNASTSFHTDAPANPIPRTFVSAIEAFVYEFPASASTILYISKVDGTGQGVYPSPTSTLLRAFLAFYTSPQSPLYACPVIPRHLWVHLFARSQRQYLFPNSADHPNKKPLGDVALCRWWKTILGDVAKAVETEDNMDASRAPVVLPKEIEHSIRLYYILPGHTEVEASSLLRDAPGSAVSSRVQWIYSQPYTLDAETGIPFPSGTTPKAVAVTRAISLAQLIPHFEDDPKSRFLDELAATSEEQAVAIPTPTPRRKRQKIGENSQDVNSKTGLDQEVQDVSPDISKDENGGTSTETGEESFGQLPTIMYIPPSSSPPRVGSPSRSPRPSTPEPIGTPQHTTRLPHTPILPTFTSLLSPHTPPADVHRLSHTSWASRTPTSQNSPRTPHTPRRPKSDLDTISPTEFWERMSFRQECAVGAVTGFFVAIFSRKPHGGRTDTLLPSINAAHDETKAAATIDVPSTLLSIGTIPHSILKRVMTSLLTGVEFSTVERAQKGTNVIESAIKGLCLGLKEGGPFNGDAMANDPKIEDVEVDNQACDTSHDVYTSHVYGSVSVTNPALARKSEDGAGKAAVVHVLGVRRKKKREERES